MDDKDQNMIDSSIAFYQMRVNDQRLRQVIRQLLLSADAEWEQDNEGHDWAEACQEARLALATQYDKWPGAKDAV